MTDQPKPRLRGPLNPAEYQGLTYLSDASSRIALDLNSDLLNALAEVERLKSQLADYKSFHEEEMKTQTFLGKSQFDALKKATLKSDELQSQLATTSKGSMTDQTKRRKSGGSEDV